jgi:DNA mismatch repair ATPase MutS
LYSGTNPLEATKSAYAFLAYLAKHDHVNFILTTHYVSLCSKLKKSKALRKRIENYKMMVDMDEHDGSSGKIVYTYKIKSGISKVQGAVHILREMDYPEEILDTIRRSK